MAGEDNLKIIFRNAAANIFGAIFQFGLILIGTRIAVREMGADAFGVLALVGGTSGYFAYLDIGAGETMIKKVSETRDPLRLSKTVSTLFFFGAGMGFVLMAAVALFGVFGAARVFSLPPPLGSGAARMFLVIASGLWLLYPLNLFTKVLVGLNRLDWYNYLRMVFQPLILALLVLALKTDASPEWAAAAITLGGLFWHGSAFVLIRRLFPGVDVTPRHFDRGLLKDLLRYKAFAAMGQFSGLLIYQGGLYLSGILLDPARVALFSVANLIALKLAEMAGVLGTAALPVISGLYGAENSAAIRRSYRMSVKGMAAVLVPPGVFLFAHAEDILRLWVGAAFTAAAPVMCWLLGAWFLNSVTMMAALTMKSVNRPDMEARMAMTVCAITLALDYVLIGRYGIVGGAYGAFIGQSVSFLLMLVMVCRLVNADVGETAARLSGIGVIGAITGAVYLFPLPGRLFFIAPLLHMLFFYPLVYRLVFNREERGLIAHIGTFFTPLGRRT